MASRCRLESFLGATGARPKTRQASTWTSTPTKTGFAKPPASKTCKNKMCSCSYWEKNTAKGISQNIGTQIAMGSIIDLDEIFNESKKCEALSSILAPDL